MQTGASMQATGCGCQPALSSTSTSECTVLWHLAKRLTKMETTSGQP